MGRDALAGAVKESQRDPTFGPDPVRFVTGDEIYCSTIDYADNIDYVK